MFTPPSGTKYFRIPVSVGASRHVSNLEEIATCFAPWRPQALQKWKKVPFCLYFKIIFGHNNYTDNNLCNLFTARSCLNTESPFCFTFDLTRKRYVKCLLLKTGYIYIKDVLTDLYRRSLNQLRNIVLKLYQFILKKCSFSPVPYCRVS